MSTQRNIKCNHEYVTGVVLVNLLTNGRTTNHTKWKIGEGLYASTEAVMQEANKCIHCGHTATR